FQTIGQEVGRVEIERIEVLAGQRADVTRVERQVTVQVFRNRERQILDVRVHIIGVVGLNGGDPARQGYLLHREDRRTDRIRNLVLRHRSQIQIGVSVVALVDRQKLAAGSLPKSAFGPVEMAAANVLNLVAAAKHGVRGRIPGEAYRWTEVVQVARIGS